MLPLYPFAFLRNIDHREGKSLRNSLQKHYHTASFVTGAVQISQEVTEREVPSTRLHSGLRNGNGYHDNNRHPQSHHVEIEKYPERQSIQPLQSREPKNAEYSESASISRIPAHGQQEHCYGVRYDNPRGFREEFRMVPGQPKPGEYYSTYTQCFIGSKYRRYKETVYIQLKSMQVN